MRVRLRTQLQKDGYGAKAGQVIRGNLARGGDGKFTAAGSASAAKPKPKAPTAAQLRAQKQAEREAREAERKRLRIQRQQERAEKQLARQLAAKKKAEEAAKKKGGGGGGKKKDDKSADKALKEQQRRAEQRRKERQAERKDKARAAERQQAQAQRQAEAQQRRTETQARQQASAAERASRQQAQAQRQQQSDAQRAQRETERKQRQAASDAARAKRDAARQARQAAMDARRAKLDAAREKMQAQLQARRDAAEARAKAKFGAWQKDQARKAKAKDDGKGTKAPSATDANAPTSASATPTAPATPTAAKERRRRRQADGAQKSASIVLAKREASTRTFAHSFAIAKVDAEQRIVEGIASSEVPDRQPGLWKGQYYAGDIVAAEAIAKALPDYLEYGNIREMHQPSAVGVVLSAEMRERQLYLVVKVVDDAAWQKVVEGVYKGFSIGGACDDAEIIKDAGRAYRKITALTLTEISLVDRPANPAARFTLWKGTGMEHEEAELQKAAGDPTKAIAALQQLRDAAELAGDLHAAQAYSLAIAAALEGAGIAQPDEDGAEDIEEEPAEVVEAPEDDLAMAEGLDELPDDEAMMAMASRIGDIAKVGRSVSGANLAHLTSIHDAIKKIAGDALCKAEDATPEPEAQIAQAQPSGDLQKVADLQATIEALTKRLEQVEAQPVAGGPILRATDKQLPGEQPSTTTVRKSAYSRADLQRLALSEPNPTLRAQYAAELAALGK